MQAHTNKKNQKPPSPKISINIFFFKFGFYRIFFYLNIFLLKKTFFLPKKNFFLPNFFYYFFEIINMGLF